MLKSTLQIDELHRIINAFSFYIAKTNKAYKYNLTYLDSYCENFYNIKNAICKKQKSVEVIVNKVKGCFNNVKDKRIITSFDGYWIYEMNYYDSNYIQKIHYGEINDKLLLNSKIYIEIVQFTEGNESNYSTYIEINTDSINNTIDEISKYFS